jgi:thioredoxin-related protein
MTTIRLILASALLATGLAGATVASAQDALPMAQDLAADARAAASSNRALVVLYSTPGCPWCARVRREYLGPMSRSADEAKRVIIREVDIESAAALVAPDGTKTTHRDFARASRVLMTPTVAFLGADGKAAAPPIVGFSGDFFGAYLDERIEQARRGH